MAFATNIVNPAVEKHALTVIKPRLRVNGWTAYATNIWSVPFTLGNVSRMWFAFDYTDGLPKAGAYPPSALGFYYDQSAKVLYVNWGSVTPDDPTFASVSGTIPGLTAEYELYLSETAFTGPSDPLDPTSTVVDWQPVLLQSPQAQSGSVQTLYGFSPLVEGSISFSNKDGWLWPHLYGSSFNLATVRSYVLANKDLETGALNGDASETFRGYLGAPSVAVDGSVTIPTFDFLSFLDRPANPAVKFNTSDFPLVDPNAVLPNQAWWIRRVRGMVENFEPVQIDFNTTISTLNNRKFLTHESTPGDGWISQLVNTGGANTATRSYFTTTPKCNIGDLVRISRSGSVQPTTVLAVNRALNYVDHTAITGSAAAGDSMVRTHIGWLKVKDSTGVWWNLFPGTHYSTYDNVLFGNTPHWQGFLMANNWEGSVGFPGPFDPTKHTVLCRVYGTSNLDLYSGSATTVGAVSNDGGVAAQSVSLLYWLLTQSGIPPSMIDQASFSAVPTNHALGVALPRARGDANAGTYREIITLVLQSMIWRLGYVSSNSQIKIGLLETAPFAAPSVTVDDNDYRSVQFQHDYNDLYSAVKLRYMKQEQIRTGDTSVIYGPISGALYYDTEFYAYVTNQIARDVHFIAREFDLEILQYRIEDATVIAKRYAFILADRRAFYVMRLGPEFLAQIGIGNSYQINRTELPGFSLTAGKIRSRQAAIIEVQNSANEVILTLEDQKGIQDNSGSWP